MIMFKNIIFPSFGFGVRNSELEIRWGQWALSLVLISFLSLALPGERKVGAPEDIE